MRTVGSQNEKSEWLRGKIIEAALGVFLEKGIFDGSLDAICTAADVSKGSLFHHFSSKEALAAEITASALRSLHRAAPIHSTVGAREGIVGLVGGTLDWCEKHRALGLWLMTAPRWLPGDPDAKPIEELLKLRVVYVGQWLRASHRARHFRKLPITAYEPLILGPTWHFLSSWVHRRKQKELKRMRPLLIDAAWKAVAR